MPRPKRREATPRRIAAAKRFLAKQVDKAGLFAAEVAAELPTPEERIENFEDGAEEAHRHRRDGAAKTWVKARALLRKMPDADRCLTAWRNCGQPGDAAYFIEFVRGWEKRRADLDRPLTGLEADMLGRLTSIAPEWLPVEPLEFRERIALHELVIRGFAAKRFVDNKLQLRISTAHCQVPSVQLQTK